MIAMALSHTASVRLAEVGFLLFVIAGVWLVASQLQAQWRTFRIEVAGVLIAVAGVLLIIAVHSGAL